MKSTVTALFIGLGSIGTRHLNNLTAISKAGGFTLIADAVRSSLRALPFETSALLNKQYTDFDNLPHYDIAFVTNPTNKHYDTLCALRGKADTIFIEKPIFDNTDYSLDVCLNENQKAYVAAPMRYCGTMIALKELLPALQPYSARIICSSYLPEWRRGVDYRTVYSAHKAQGGGVTIDLIHEWDYMAELFGMPIKAYNFKGKYSNLEIDSDDLSVYIAQYPTMLAEIHLDYFGRKYRRSIELFCKDGTVTADFGDGTLTLANGEIREYKEDVNERYIRELQYFLSFAFDDAPCTNSAQTALRVLKLTLGE